MRYNTLTFFSAVSTDMRAVEVVPAVDGSLLTELVAAFETSKGWDSAGGYGGLFPSVFRLGPATPYWLGEDPGGGRVFALGCECGEMACWPLAVSVVHTADTISWRGVNQPNRPERDYGSFGPFIFGRPQYEAAVASIAPLFGDGF